MTAGLPTGTKDDDETNTTASASAVLSLANKDDEDKPSRPRQTGDNNLGDPSIGAKTESKTETVSGSDLKIGDRILVNHKELVIFDKATKVSAGNTRDPMTGHFASYSFIGKYQRIK